MRLAFKKYFELGKCGSYVEAIRLLNKNHIEPIFTGAFESANSGDVFLPKQFHSEWRHH